MKTSCTSPAWILRACVLTVVLLVSDASVSATTIGVNFAPVASGHLLPAGTSAGVVPQMNWQNITSTPVSSVMLNDSTGAASGASLSVTGSFVGLGWYNSAAAIGDEWLMDTNLAASGTMSFSVSSIPYAAYDLIIYNQPLFSGVTYTYAAGGTSYYGASPLVSNTSAGYVDGNSGTPFTFVEATSTLPGSPTPGSTYTRFEGLSGSHLTFSITGGNGISYINGFQIVESVPEPSRALLLLGGLLAISGRRGRRAV
ncbi:MAG: PEP-CTERM sorting domain-containing protein [Verrucomicrobiaceae bacterium]|nr:PEP-CTERM sorting domain-containing protein [Verrucomicrobiaceae bacterium]